MNISTNTSSRPQSSRASRPPGKMQVGGDQKGQVERKRDAEQPAVQRRGVRFAACRDAALAEHAGRQAQQQQQQRHQRQHVKREGAEGNAGELPEKQVLRIADGRERRTRINRQRLKNDQPGGGHAGDAAHPQRQRHHDKQRHVVGQQR